MDWLKSLYCFQLNYHQPCNNNIQSVATIEIYPFINNRHTYLPLKGNILK